MSVTWRLGSRWRYANPRELKVLQWLTFRWVRALWLQMMPRVSLLTMLVTPDRSRDYRQRSSHINKASSLVSVKQNYGHQFHVQQSTRSYTCRLVNCLRTASRLKKQLSPSSC